MKLFFEKVRTPKKDMSLKIQIMVTIGIIVFGFALGVFDFELLKKSLKKYPVNALAACGQKSFCGFLQKVF